MTDVGVHVLVVVKMLTTPTMGIEFKKLNNAVLWIVLLSVWCLRGQSLKPHM
jgi:hypothetical protein